MSSITVTIPGTLPRELSPNGRSHWAAKNRAAQERRNAAYWSTWDDVARADPDWTDWHTRPTMPLVLHVLVAWEPLRKTMDDDNLWAAFKPCRDGIAEALGIDDKHMTCGSITQTRDDDKRGYIKVAIEEATP